MHLSTQGCNILIFSLFLITHAELTNTFHCLQVLFVVAKLFSSKQ
jgi:hypothetical protein